MQELFRAVLSTNNIDNCAWVCHAPTVAGLAKSFGSGAMNNSFKDFAKAKMIIVIGRNMTEAHPVAATFVKNAVDDGAELIVVDPRYPGAGVDGLPFPGDLCQLAHQCGFRCDHPIGRVQGVCRSGGKDEVGFKKR